MFFIHAPVPPAPAANGDSGSSQIVEPFTLLRGSPIDMAVRYYEHLAQPHGRVLYQRMESLQTKYVPGISGPADDTENIARDMLCSERFRSGDGGYEIYELLVPFVWSPLCVSDASSRNTLTKTSSMSLAQTQDTRTEDVKQ